MILPITPRSDARSLYKTPKGVTVLLQTTKWTEFKFHCETNIASGLEDGWLVSSAQAATPPNTLVKRVYISDRQVNLSVDFLVFDFKVKKMHYQGI